MAANLDTSSRCCSTAKADAPLAGLLADDRRQAGRPEAEGPARQVPARRRCWSSGQNNVLFWTGTVDRLAVAVTEEAPFTIEIVEPKVPAGPGGSMGLKVVAKRKAGFKAPIAVDLLWNPPGVGSAGGIAIAEGQNEAVIPMNADGGAELRTWKIVVNGAADASATGPVVVSSQLANLTRRRAVRRPSPSSGQRRAGQGDRHGRQGRPRHVDFAGEAKVTLLGLPNKVTTDVEKITKDTNELVFHIKTDKASPGRQPREPVLPGGRDAERRADRAQPRRGRAADRRAAAAEGRRPDARPPRRPKPPRSPPAAQPPAASG